MSRTTEIEWCQHTWNPFVGCEIVSAGCKNCYAMRMAARLQGFGVKAYQGVVKSTKAGPVWTGKVHRSSDETMRKPLRIREPSLIFVNSMSDWFNPDADDLWRHESLDIMEEASQHEYQVLTKRPEHIKPILKRMKRRLPENFWLGATVEDHRVVHRIDLIREVDAAIRYLSVEPMTAPLGKVNLAGIHWVITGGESGPKARPMDWRWAADVRDQCLDAGVPYFHKQWGKWQNNPVAHRGEAAVKRYDPHGKGGCKLDGREWKEWPRLPGMRELRKPLAMA